MFKVIVAMRPRGYPVYIGHDLLARLPGLLARRLRSRQRRAVVVCDSRLARSVGAISLSIRIGAQSPVAAEVDMTIESQAEAIMIPAE